MKGKCVACGESIPAGRLLCLNCEAKTYVELEKMDAYLQRAWMRELDRQREEFAKDEDEDDQDIKADSGKPKLSLVPTEIINCIARVREFGNRKYGDSESWRRVDKQRYKDAMFRHLLKYVNDSNSVDEESGLPHLWHLACNVAFLCEMEKE